jgi:phosphonate transport system substrate-binding protein
MRKKTVVMKLSGLRTSSIAACLALALACPGPQAAPDAAGARRPYVLAVHPYLNAEEIQKRFAPLAQILGNAIGRRVEVRVGRDYEEHERAVGQDAVDIAYVGPVPYVRLASRYGPKPLLARVETHGSPTLRGVIFVRADSAFRKVSDLKGKRFAFGDETSTTGSILPRYVLLVNGVHIGDLTHSANVQSHNNVLLGVLSGDFDAGAMRKDVFDEAGERGLRVLENLPEVTEHVFVARSDLPAQDVARLRAALLHLASAPEGLGALHAISAETTGMVPASDADFESLRRIMRRLAEARE